MSATLRNKWDAFYHHNEARPYYRTYQREKSLTLDGMEYTCWLDLNIRLWENDDHEPEVERLWPVQPFDKGGHEVTSPELKAQLQVMALEWCRENLGEIVEEMKRKENE